MKSNKIFDIDLDVRILGIPEIDAEHAEFVDLLCHSHVETKDDLIKLLNAIAKFWVKHTETEAKFMSFVNYPHKSEHLFSHSIICNFVRSSYARFAFMTCPEPPLPVKEGFDILTEPEKQILPTLGKLFQDHFDHYDLEFLEYADIIVEKEEVH